ncbi:MAG: transcriptional repressor NrdR [Planctomycetes bacterium]|nr:transcriptional repressor NrdR [Planctomycetota bacterium]MBI3834613.1 transcriptional repressor NrdR [Planctomycetota bacterium]
MLCPSCRENDNKVIDSRLTEGGSAIRRRRVCTKCNRRFTTKERVEEEIRLAVIKNAGERVPYSRDNIVSGVLRACTKLNVNESEVEALVDNVESDIFAAHDREVSTEQIGAFVGRHLRRLNSVAYVRFMSVHRKFSTVDEFVDEIREVRNMAEREAPEQRPLFEA